MCSQVFDSIYLTSANSLNDCDRACDPSTPPYNKPWVSYVLFNPTARQPTKPSSDCANFNLYSSVNVSIQPGKTVLVSTGVGFSMPRSICGLITGASGLFVKGLLVESQVLSPDGNKNIQVAILNLNSVAHLVKEGDFIGHITFVRALNQRAIYPARQDPSSDCFTRKQTAPRIVSSTPRQKKTKLHGESSGSE